MRRFKAIVIALCLLMVPSYLVAASYDGSVPLLCTAMTVLECEDIGECQRRTAMSVGLPPFLIVDFDKKLVRAPDAHGGRSSALKNIERLDARIVLQGGEEGRGWTIVIDEDTGTMSAAVTGHQVGFVVFGACIPR
jgi:hypothetical protein